MKKTAMKEDAHEIMNIQEHRLHRSVTERETETGTTIADAELLKWNIRISKNVQNKKNEQAITACSYHLVNLR